MARARTPITFEILNIQQITNYFRDTGDITQKIVKKAARAGAIIVKRKAVSNAQTPEEHGILKKSIQYFEEKKKEGKRNVTAKSGFDVSFDNKYNFIFQKKYHGYPRRGSKRPRSGDQAYYYPASMEYGFANKSGGVGGLHFLRATGREQHDAVSDKMLEVLSKEIDAIKTRGRSNA